MIFPRNLLKVKIILLVLISTFSFFVANFRLLAQKKSVATSNASPSPKKKVKTFRVDFREKDIHDFLKAMSKIIGKNIIADESVKGKITVISPQRIPATRAFAYLTSVLAVKGYGVVVEDKLLRIISLKDAVAKGRLIHVGRKPLEKEWVRKNIVVTAILEVKHADPSRLAGILKRVTNKNTEIVDFKETNSLILTGGALEVDRLLRIIVRLDKPISEPDVETIPGGNIYIVRLKNMESDKIEATLKKITLPPSLLPQGKQRRENKAAVRSKKIEVVSHPESNSIIYVGNKQEWRVIKDLIKKIDVNRDQILLEVLIAEVRENNVNQFGLDLRYSKADGAFSTQFNSGIASKAASALGQGATVQNIFNSLAGFSLGFFDGSILGILNANKANDNFLVLSAPQILTLNNQEAEIDVGQDVPVQTSQRTLSASSQDTINQFDYRPTGVKLKVTPRINSNQEITLKLNQEIKEVSGSTAGAIALPQFTKREIKTTIKVDNEQTIVIGGLISTNRSKEVVKVPLLGDIPLLGYLFKRSTTQIRRTNLLVFITPHILTDRAIADKFTKELKESQTKQFKGIK